MLREEDLIGTWVIIETKLKLSTPESQLEIDNINSKYEVTYNSNGIFSESNNGIIFGRSAILSGKWSLVNNTLVMNIRTFFFKRNYTIINISTDKSKITLSPCESLYCDTYSNIDYIIINKK